MACSKGSDAEEQLTAKKTSAAIVAKKQRGQSGGIVKTEARPHATVPTDAKAKVKKRQD